VSAKAFRHPTAERTFTQIGRPFADSRGARASGHSLCALARNPFLDVGRTLRQYHTFVLATNQEPNRRKVHPSFLCGPSLISRAMCANSKGKYDRTQLQRCSPRRQHEHCSRRPVHSRSSRSFCCGRYAGRYAVLWFQRIPLAITMTVPTLAPHWSTQSSLDESLLTVSVTWA